MTERVSAMDHDILTLKQDAELYEPNGRPGLKLDGDLKIAADDQEALLLRSLFSGPRTTAELTELLYTEDGPVSGDAYAALKLAEFILNFEKYLES